MRISVVPTVASEVPSAVTMVLAIMAVADRVMVEVIVLVRDVVAFGVGPNTSEVPSMNVMVMMLDQSQSRHHLLLISCSVRSEISPSKLAGKGGTHEANCDETPKDRITKLQCVTS